MLRAHNLDLRIIRYFGNRKSHTHKARDLKDTIKDKCRAGICSNLTSGLPTILFEGGLVCDCICVRSAHQAQFQSELVVSLGLVDESFASAEEG